MDDKIIPFGKHKGKPVELLATDKEYTDWLLAQSWFKENYTNIYNVVINNFREPVETPEHNKMQVQFLKFEYRLKLAYFIYRDLFNNNTLTINNAIRKILQSKPNQASKVGILNSLINPDKKNEFGLYTRILLHYTEPVFEKVDVSFGFYYGLKFYYEDFPYRSWTEFNQLVSCSYFIEIKPTISDDFPSVLRQMKASMPVKASTEYFRTFYILLIREYTGLGASKAEFIEYFRTQGYIVVFENELENIELPKYDKEFLLADDIEEMLRNE